MDSTRKNQASQPKSKLAKTFHKVMHLKTSTKSFSNNGFCILIPQEKLKCCESKQFMKDDIEESAKDLKNKTLLEAFVAKLFASISSFKAAYAELQIAQFPYNDEAIKAADQAVVDELKAISQLKFKYIKKCIDSSPPHVTLMLAEIQEQQSLMKTYEITMKKMQGEVENREGKILSLRKELNEIKQQNKSMENNYTILDNVDFSRFNLQDFVMVLNYGLRSIRSFVKMVIKEMANANWDIEVAANAIQPDVNFDHRSHRGFAFESFVCREIFNGFHEPSFSLRSLNKSGDDDSQIRLFFFEQFKKMKSVNVVQFLKENQNSLFGKFLKSKYLQMIHPKMEFSFSGNLNQRKKMVNSGELFPDTEFCKAFAEMGRRVWVLHCLAFSFGEEVSVFQVKKGCRFSEVYMESVVDDGGVVVAGSESRVAFTVVPGFKVGKMVVQSQVYLSHDKSHVKY